MQGLEFYYDTDKHKLSDYLDYSSKDGHLIMRIKDNYLICNQCKRIKRKTFGFFPRDKTKSDGMRKTCKACVGNLQLLKRFNNDDRNEVIKKLEFFVANPSMANFAFDYEEYLKSLKDGTIHPTYYFKYKEIILTAYFILLFKGLIKRDHCIPNNSKE